MCSQYNTHWASVTCLWTLWMCKLFTWFTALCIVKVLLNALKLSFYRRTHTHTHSHSAAMHPSIPSLGTHMFTKCTSSTTLICEPYTHYAQHAATHPAPRTTGFWFLPNPLHCLTLAMGSRVLSSITVTAKAILELSSNHPRNQSPTYGLCGPSFTPAAVFHICFTPAPVSQLVLNPKCPLSPTSSTRICHCPLARLPESR